MASFGLTHQSHCEPLATSKYCAVSGSSPFDDSTLAARDKSVYVTGMKVHIRQWDGRPVIGGLKVFYSTGDEMEHGKIPCNGKVEEFHLKKDERIVSVTARAGWLIDSLEFHTSHYRIFGPYGGDGGSIKIIECPHDPQQHSQPYLAYIKGHVDITQSEVAVRHLEFLWGFHNITSEENL